MKLPWLLACIITWPMSVGCYILHVFSSNLCCMLLHHLLQCVCPTPRFARMASNIPRTAHDFVACCGAGRCYMTWLVVAWHQHDIIQSCVIEFSRCAFIECCCECVNFHGWGPLILRWFKITVFSNAPHRCEIALRFKFGVSVLSASIEQMETSWAAKFIQHKLREPNGWSNMPNYPFLVAGFDAFWSAIITIFPFSSKK